MKYFENIETIEELKKEYKRLARKHHPDLGGNTETMKDINNQYEKASKLLDKDNKEDNSYIDIINDLIILEGIEIEIIGTWIWVSGDTKPVKDKLKELGFKWAKKKEMWAKSPNGEYTRSRGKTEINDIRAKYGSKVIKGKKEDRPKGLGNKK